MDKLSYRAKTGSLRSYRGKDFTDRVSRNEYNETDNPEGIIDLGGANNKLCADLILEKLNSPAAPKLTSDHLHYPTLHGTAALRQSLVSFIKKYFHATIPFTESNLIVTTGLITGLEQLVFCIADEGDVILVPSPFWDKLPKVLNERCHVALKLVPLSPEDGYTLTKEMLELALAESTAKGAKVAGLILINPSNPLGLVYSKAQITDILQFAKSHNIHVILDEIYTVSVYDDKANFGSALTLDELPDPERTHVTWATSKALGLSGHRCGVVVTWNEAILASLKSLAAYSMVPAIIQAQVAWLLWQHDWLDNVFLPTLTSRLRVASERYRERLAAMGVSTLTPQAGLFLWADFSKFLDEPSFDAECRLVDRFISTGVYCRPGHTFYAAQPGFFRIVFTENACVMNLAMDRIEKAICSEHVPSADASIGFDLDLGDFQIVGASTKKGGTEGMEDVIKSLRDCINASDWLNPQVPEREAQERVWTVLEPCDQLDKPAQTVLVSNQTEQGDTGHQASPRIPEPLQGAASESTNGADSLEEMMRSLKQSIRSTDWLEAQEGSWEKDNPEAAVEYRKAMTEQSEAAECKTQ